MSQRNGRKAKIQRMYDCLAGIYDVWLSLAHRADINLMVEMLDLGPDDEILDIGTGPGIIPVKFRKTGVANPICGVDLSPGQIERAKKKASRLGRNQLSFQVGDMEGLPIESKRYSRLTCVGALLLAEDKAAALGEFHRVLEPGGLALLVEPKAERIKKTIFYPGFNAFVKAWAVFRPELRGLSEEDFRGRDYFDRQSLLETVEAGPLELLQLEEDRTHYYCLCGRNGA